MTPRLTLRIFIGVALLLTVLQFVDIGEVARSLRNLQPHWLAASGACFLATRILMGVKWWMLLGGKSSAVSYAVVQRAIFLSDFYGLMFPNSVAVDATRVVLLRHHEGGVSFAAATIVADRLVNVAITAATSLLAMGLLWLWKGGVPFSTSATIIAIGLALVVVVACALVTSLRVMTFLMRLARMLTRITPRLVWLTGALNAAEKTHTSMIVMLTTQSTAIPVVALTCLFILARVGSIYFLFHAVGEPQPFVMTLALVPIILLIVLLPVSLLGLGLNEGAFVFFFGSAGVSPSVALAASLANYFVVIGGNFFFGSVASFVGPALPKPTDTSTLNSRTGDTRNSRTGDTS